MTEQVFYAHGKLLITAEYFVLDGVEALAVPTKQGQSLIVKSCDSAHLQWKSYDNDGQIWFEADLDFKNYDLISSTDEAVGTMLSTILKKAKTLNPEKNFNPNFNVETHLDFPRKWGLGTSSTLIYNISQLFGVNPYTLLKETFGGSGYDIACAGAQNALLYTTQKGISSFKNVDFNPIFKDNIYFVYLGKKQNSREGIARYREKAENLPPLLYKESFGHKSPFGQYFAEISALTQAFLVENDLNSFEKLIVEHENIVASMIELPRAKSLFFNDFWGEVKSLGAWGGDFVMVTSDRSFKETSLYFETKGFDFPIQYNNMVL